MLVSTDKVDSDYMLYYGLPTNPSIEILSEITKIYDLGFDLRISTLVNAEKVKYNFTKCMTSHRICS